VQEGRLADVAAALLCGGASRRMGRDKAAMPIGGEAAATRLARLLSALCDELLLVGGEPPADAPGRRVPDLPGPRCALRGLASALSAARAERVLVLATDLPLVGDALLLGLVAWPEADAVLARDAQGPQPLCGVYRRERALAVAERRLSAGRELALRGLLDELEIRVLPEDFQRALDPDGSALTNVNSPEELLRVQALLRSAAQRSDSVTEKVVP
jgi:molybdopterin-guanine dinucleotide biosynthesis protein A